MQVETHTPTLKNETQEKPQVLYSRYADGTRPVVIRESGTFEVLSSEGKPIVLGTKRELLAELTGHSQGRNWSFDRYFQLGAYRPEREVSGSTIFDIFGVPLNPYPRTDSGLTLLEPLAPAVLGLRESDPSITVAPGIDLEGRYDEVRKLMFAGFGRRIFHAGYDPEDVLQEVYRGLLARNEGVCPWDPSKSSFGHYVHMVCSCVLANYHRKQTRQRQVEQVGLGCMKDGEWRQRDVSEHPSLHVSGEDGHLVQDAAEDLSTYMLEKGGRDSKLAARILPYVAEGTARQEIADQMGVSMAAVSRAVSFLRVSAREWYGS